MAHPGAASCHEVRGIVVLKPHVEDDVVVPREGLRHNTLTEPVVPHRLAQAPVLATAADDVSSHCGVVVVVLWDRTLRWSSESRTALPTRLGSEGITVSVCPE